MGIGCPPLTGVSLLWRIFAILWEKKEKKTLNNINNGFFFKTITQIFQILISFLKFCQISTFGYSR
jgi:hypothetical protein